MAAVPEIMAGCVAGLYTNGGTWGTPVWTEVPIIKDVKPQFPWDFGEARSRLTPVKLYAKTGVDVPIQVVMRADPADGDYAAWVAAAGERTTFFDVLCLNAKISVEGACGVRGPYLLSMAEEPQEIEGIIYATFDLKPTMDEDEHVPVWALVGASEVGFIDITY